MELNEMTCLCAQKRNYPLRKSAILFVTTMGDTVSPFPGKNRGHNYPTTDKWQNPRLYNIEKT